MAGANGSNLIPQPVTVPSNLDSLALDPSKVQLENLIQGGNGLIQPIEILVEETAQLVHRIPEWQATLSNHQLAMQQGTVDQAAGEKYLAEVEGYLGNLWTRLNEITSTELVNRFVEIIGWQSEQQKTVDKETEKWKSKKRLFLYGGSAENVANQYNELKKMFDFLETLALGLLKQIEKYIVVLKDLSDTYNCQVHMQKCKNLAEECMQRKKEAVSYIFALIQKSLLVYNEPPSIIRRTGVERENVNHKKGTKIPFEMEIRFLAGIKSGFLRENLETEALLISEQQARDFVEGKTKPVDASFVPAGRIGYPTCILQAPVSEDCIAAKFINVRVQKLPSDKEADKFDSSRVMFHILFRLKQKRTANGTTTYFPFWAISLPFSVVINANRQEKYKRALMFWQLAFLTDDKTSLSTFVDEKNETSNRVPWSKFFAALNILFKRVNTEKEKEKGKAREKETVFLERGLDEHEVYIKEKLGLNSKESGGTVAWDMFYKVKNSNKITFWEFLYPVMEYIGKYPSYWDSGMILGFASRQRVEQLLNGVTVPSMILKFSDSRPGKMVASYINWNAKKEKIIEHVIFDEDEDKVFENKSLVECVQMSVKLQVVTQILPIKKPLSNFYNLEMTEKKKSTKADGYVKPGIVFTWGDPPVAPPSQDQDQLMDGTMDVQFGLGHPAPIPNHLPGVQQWLHSTPSPQRSSTDSNSQPSFSRGYSSGSISSPESYFLYNENEREPFSVDSNLNFGFVPTPSSVSSLTQQSPPQSMHVEQPYQQPQQANGQPQNYYQQLQPQSMHVEQPYQQNSQLQQPQNQYQQPQQQYTMQQQQYTQPNYNMQPQQPQQPHMQQQQHVQQHYMQQQLPQQLQHMELNQSAQNYVRPQASVNEFFDDTGVMQCQRM